MHCGENLHERNYVEHTYFSLRDGSTEGNLCDYVREFYYQI